MRFRISPALAVAALMAATLLVACGGNDAADGDGGETTPDGPATDVKIQVLTSLEIFADIVREVGGDRVEAHSLAETAADFESFEPTRADIENISKARAIIINGTNLDASILDTINEYRHGSSQLVRVSRNVPSPSEAKPPEREPSAEDVGDNPYLWLDLDLVPYYVESIADVLFIVDGANTAYYQDNARRYRETLTELGSELKAEVDNIPDADRKLVTLNDFYPHLARYSGLEVVGTLQPDPKKQPTDEDISRLASKIEEEGVSAVFRDALADATAIQALSEKAGVPICTLYSTSLDDDVTSYAEMMRFNVEELVRCL